MQFLDELADATDEAALERMSEPALDGLASDLQAALLRVHAQQLERRRPERTVVSAVDTSDQLAATAPELGRHSQQKARGSFKRSASALLRRKKESIRPSATPRKAGPKGRSIASTAKAESSSSSPQRPQQRLTVQVHRISREKGEPGRATAAAGE